ncbi:MAG: DUF4190 domain-containing protein [Myxococcaceae bacterium]|nr:DUF4190 domain-containing protein [Myxococcaceae bacterium]
MEPATPPPPSPRPSYRLPVVAFVLSLLGLCVCILYPVALVLGILSLKEIRQNPALPHRDLARAAIALSLILPFVTVLFMLAIYPRLPWSRAYAYQRECRTTLKGMYVRQGFLWKEHQRYTEDVAELNTPVERGNRYAYFLSTRGPFEDRSRAQEERPQGATGVLADSFKGPVDAAPAAEYTNAIPPLAGNVKPGLSGTCPRCDITLVCVGQLDGDTTVDVWSLSTKERQGPKGLIPAGEPYNESNDVVD